MPFWQRPGSVSAPFWQPVAFLPRRADEPYDLALEYAAIGEAEEAMRWLERSYERREVDMIALRVAPRLDAVRDRPAFAALVERVGLPGS